MVLLQTHINLSLASLHRDAITTACSVVSTSFTAIQPRCATGAVFPGDTNRCYQTSCSLSKSWNRAAPSQHYPQYSARAKRNVDVFDKCTYNSHPNKYWGALLIYRVKAADVSTTQQCPSVSVDAVGLWLDLLGVQCPQYQPNKSILRGFDSDTVCKTRAKQKTCTNLPAAFNQLLGFFSECLRDSVVWSFCKK